MNKSLERTKSRRLPTKTVLAFLALGFYGIMPSSPMTMCLQAGEAKPGPTVRFDELVRNDFFAGMMGDKGKAGSRDEVLRRDFGQRSQTC